MTVAYIRTRQQRTGGRNDEKMVAGHQCWAKQEEARLGFSVCRWSPSGLSLSTCGEERYRWIRNGRFAHCSFRPNWRCFHTKATSTGADLSRKNTCGLEEVDERNPACTAGNVDNKVGDVVGMRDDVFGSCAESTWAALALVVSSEELEHSWKALMCPVLNSTLRVAIGAMTLVPRYAMYRVHAEYGTILSVTTVLLCLVVVLCGSCLPDEFDESETVNRLLCRSCLGYGLASSSSASRRVTSPCHVSPCTKSQKRYPRHQHGTYECYCCSAVADVLARRFRPQ